MGLILANSTEWFVYKAEKWQGPFSSGQLKKLATAGKVSEKTKIKRSADDKVTTAGKIKGLFPSSEIVEKKTQVAKPTQVREPQTAVIIPKAPVAQSPAVDRIPCRYCGEDIAETAVKCKHCGEFLDGRPQPQQAAPQQINVAPQPQAPVNVTVVQNVGDNSKRWSRLIAGLLSLVIPGLGQLYKGQFLNAVVWFVLTIIGYVALVIPGVILHVLCVIGAMTGNPRK